VPCSQTRSDSHLRTEQPSRPELRERRAYEPNLPQERFIVPVLKSEIERCIARFGKPVRFGAKAVDIGCGGQPFRPVLEESGYSYCAVDVNPDGGPPVDIVCAADDAIPEALMRRGPFDLLLCTEVLEHVAHWERALSNFSLLLSPGGRAIITAPFVYQLHEEPYDFWRPTIHAFDVFARELGFTTLYRRQAGDVWSVIGTVLATCHFSSRTRRLRDRIVLRIIKVATHWAHHGLLSGVIQSAVTAEAPYYLSNVIVFEKPVHDLARV